MPEQFHIDRPSYYPATGIARLPYRLDDRAFEEQLQFPPGGDPAAAASPAFAKLLDLCAFVLGVSYFKLRAPTEILAPELALTSAEHAFVLDIYENGLGEFYARNRLSRFGQLDLRSRAAAGPPPVAPGLANRALLPIGGGKDSLVSVELLEAAAIDYTPFAVNPRGPILSSIAEIGKPPLYVTRRLDPEMLRLAREPGYYNGHVPSTAINSMLAALAALLFGYDRIVLSNERSASEGNAMHDGREVNHQYSKSFAFETRIAAILAGATGGALNYFSLLRPYSEVRIAQLFATRTRFDHVFSSCNRNFRYDGHNGPLWCGECPKCLFVFLILAPAMEKSRLLGIFGQNLLARPEHDHHFRELTGLAGQKPWECVGEIEEAAACLYTLSQRSEWAGDAIVAALKPGLLSQYGSDRLRTALADRMRDSPEHLLPPDLAGKVSHAA